ncbi:GNAT family N-acetyltransferase [Thermococcus sp. MAR1]|uniref:GNAT family N-acetyltransferase n=1 Tax=Thermococcus sp. MAR1 TaxID=1638263 RepID=UPI001438A308|nr:GNAT family N-acetyltransferase [Thermococcus sp. MAR1]NJE09771.1 GNAT family N-acetyltransferase [Thermococcus sp. MAR1]
MKLRVREATIWDCRRIVGIYLSNSPWKDSPYETYLQVGPWGLEETCAIHLNNLKLAGGIALVAELNGKIAGETEVFISDEVWDGELVKTAHLSVIEVARWYQGKGVGRALLERVVELAKEKGCDLLTVTPEKKALGFYRKLGFNRTVYQGIIADISTDTGRRAPTAAELIPDWDDLRGLPLSLGQFQSSYNHWFSEFVDRIADVDGRVHFESGSIEGGFYVLEGSFFDRQTATAYFWGEDGLEGLRKLATLARSRGFKTLRTSLSRKLVSGRLEFGITPLDEVIILAKSL